ncbi:MAG: hypothetical protein Alpg2KO_12780 [Alphaproteobacteria bacterium]
MIISRKARGANLWPVGNKDCGWNFNGGASVTVPPGTAPTQSRHRDRYAIPVPLY